MITRQYNEPKYVVCEAIQIQTYKGIYFGELIKPFKLLSNFDFDSFSSLNRANQTRGSLGSV